MGMRKMRPGAPPRVPPAASRPCEILVLVRQQTESSVRPRCVNSCLVKRLHRLGRKFRAASIEDPDGSLKERDYLVDWLHAIACDLALLAEPTLVSSRCSQRAGLDALFTGMMAGEGTARKNLWFGLSERRPWILWKGELLSWRSFFPKV